MLLYNEKKKYIIFNIIDISTGKLPWSTPAYQFIQSVMAVDVDMPQLKDEMKREQDERTKREKKNRFHGRFIFNIVKNYPIATFKKKPRKPLENLIQTIFSLSFPHPFWFWLFYRLPFTPSSQLHSLLSRSTACDDIIITDGFFPPQYCEELHGVSVSRFSVVFDTWGFFDTFSVFYWLA